MENNILFYKIFIAIFIPTLITTTHIIIYNRPVGHNLHQTEIPQWTHLERSSRGVYYHYYNNDIYCYIIFRDAKNNCMYLRLLKSRKSVRRLDAARKRDTNRR